MWIKIDAEICTGKNILIFKKKFTKGIIHNSIVGNTTWDLFCLFLFFSFLFFFFLRLWFGKSKNTINLSINQCYWVPITWKESWYCCMNYKRAWSVSFAFKRFIIWSGRKDLSTLKHKLQYMKITWKQTEAVYGQWSNQWYKLQIKVMR